MRNVLPIAPSVISGIPGHGVSDVIELTSMVAAIAIDSSRLALCRAKLHLLLLMARQGARHAFVPASPTEAPILLPFSPPMTTPGTAPRRTGSGNGGVGHVPARRGPAGITRYNKTVAVRVVQVSISRYQLNILK